MILVNVDFGHHLLKFLRKRVILVFFVTEITSMIPNQNENRLNFKPHGDSVVEYKKVQVVKGSYYIYLPKNWCETRIGTDPKEVGLKRLKATASLYYPGTAKSTRKRNCPLQFQRVMIQNSS